MLGIRGLEGDVVARKVPVTRRKRTPLPPVEVKAPKPAPAKRRGPLPYRRTNMGVPLTCSMAGPGQSAFIAGLATLGFQLVSLGAAGGCLRERRPELFHGYRSDYGRLADAHPGLVSIVWHSGFTGSDVMGEGEILASALERARRGNLHLLWLERRDVLPAGARYLAPVWDPQRMANLAPSVP